MEWIEIYPFHNNKQLKTLKIMPIINGQGRIGVRVQVPLLLDTYTGAAAAYSLRKLSNTYNGPAIRVRRSSNNAELNIGFNSDGTLDTTTLLSFVGAGDGFVVTIYDQSGSQNNLSWWQAVTQSKIVSNGVIETLNGKPCINSTGISSSLYRFLHPVNGYIQIAYKTLYFVGKVETTSNFNAIINSGGHYDGFYAKPNSNTFGLYKHDWATAYPANPMGQRELTFAGNSMNPFMVYVNMRDMKLYAEHNGGGENLLGNWGSAMGVNYFLNSGNGNFNGKFTELLLWNSDKSANRSAINSNINSYYSIYPTDADAAAFVSAAGITDSTQQSAVNTLVTSLKSAGLWTKMKAIYPFVGGTASSHKFNLKDPRDLDAAYRLVFNGGWTHSSTGAKPNGTNGYADTNLLASSFGSNYMLSFYSRTNVDNSYASDLGAYNNNIGLEVLTRVSNTINIDVPNPYQRLSTTNLDSTGFYIIANNSTINRKVYKNSTEIISASFLNSNLESNNLIFSAWGYLPQMRYSNRELAFGGFGSGFTATDAANYYTAVQAFQTTLGRQVA